MNDYDLQARTNCTVTSHLSFIYLLATVIKIDKTRDYHSLTFELIDWCGMLLLVFLCSVMFHVLCIGICRSGSPGLWRFSKVFHENGEMWKLAEIWPPRPKCIYGDSPTWFLANQRQRPRAEDLTSLLHKCRILWLSQKLIEMVRPLSVSFLFRTSGKEYHSQAGSTTKWWGLGCI